MLVFDIKGNTVGIRLKQRGPGDLHVLMIPIIEHDCGTWYVETGGGVSSSFAQEKLNVLNKAIRWMQRNCKPDGDCGWKFKSSDWKPGK